MAFKFFDWLGNTTLTAKAKRKTPREDAASLIRGAVAPPIRTPIDPLLDDIDQVETRMLAADVRLEAPAGLIRASMRDAWAHALLKVRTSGLCTLPVIYEGPARSVKLLRAVDEAGADGFARYFPRAEQALFLEDAIVLGVGVAQILLDKANDRKIVVRRTPDHLEVRGNKWFYNSEPIKPGDGEWVVLVGALERPWLNGGCWVALTRATAKRMLGEYNRLAFVAALANAVSLIKAPLGANEYDHEQALETFSQLGTNNVKVLPVGWSAELLEIKSGVGTAAFDKVTGDAKEDIAMIICGQTVTSQGSSGSGFVNVKYFDAIRRDLSIKDAAMLDACIDQQIMPHIFKGVTRRIDLTNDNDKTVLAQRYLQAGAALTSLRSVFDDAALDLPLIIKQLGLPITATPVLREYVDPKQQSEESESDNEN